MSTTLGSDAPDLSPFGLAVGHATDVDGATGLTVVRGIDGPFRACAAIVGRATGSREMHAASPDHLVDRVDAILLTGGSAYGLDAAAGVMRWMEERGRGFSVGAGVVPIVPAAVLFDLAPLGRFDARPTPAMAYDACERATSVVAEQGSVGAGTGATVGKAFGSVNAMKGGLGCAIVDGDDVRAAAIVATNAFGDVRDAAGNVLAGSRAASGGSQSTGFAPTAMSNTTIGLVAVDVPLTRVALAQLARATTAAYFRRITPAGTTFDGDIVFATCPMGEPRVDAALALRAEVAAVRALEDAIEASVRRAVGRDGVPGLADVS